MVCRTLPPSRHTFIGGFVLLLLLLPASIVLSQPAQPPATTDSDWQSNWGVAPGFAIAIDSEGFALPAAITFVPEPGPNPDDPLYFVVELRGTVKVVTNDRTIYTFAENPHPFVPQEELPSGYGQGGTGGLCLDPQHGYVFMTFLYQDETNQLRNGLIRYDTRPGTFDIAFSEQRVLTPVFEREITGLAHFIGSCLVKDGHLYVGIGEAWQPHLAQDLNSSIGKIFRMTLDGEPLPDNPFYEDDDRTNPTNYIWAYGLRNPWALEFVGDRLFSADNGSGIDRFIEVVRGHNYLWNGSDEGIATNASYLWAPAIGPTHMDYISSEAQLFPENYRNLFMVGTSGNLQIKGGIMTVRFDLEHSRMVEPPRYFLRWLGSADQMVMGVAFGPDGLYYAPLYPGPDGTSPILKISYDPTSAHPFRPDHNAD